MPEQKSPWRRLWDWTNHLSTAVWVGSLAAAVAGPVVAWFLTTPLVAIPVSMAAAGFLAYWITARVGGRRKPREIGTKVPDAAFLERARKEAPFHKTTSKQLFVWEALVAWLPKQAAKMREIADAAERTGAFVGDEPGDFHALVCGVLRYHVEDERVYSGLLNVAYTRDPATQRFVLTDGTLRKAAAYIDGLDGKLVPWGMKRDVNTHSALSAGGTLGPPG